MSFKSLLRSSIPFLKREHTVNAFRSTRRCFTSATSIPLVPLKASQRCLISATSSRGAMVASTMENISLWHHLTHQTEHDIFKSDQLPIIEDGPVFSVKGFASLDSVGPKGLENIFETQFGGISTRDMLFRIFSYILYLDFTSKGIKTNSVRDLTLDSCDIVNCFADVFTLLVKSEHEKLKQLVAPSIYEAFLNNALKRAESLKSHETEVQLVKATVIDVRYGIQGQNPLQRMKSLSMVLNGVLKKQMRAEVDIHFLYAEKTKEIELGQNAEESMRGMQSVWTFGMDIDPSHPDTMEWDICAISEGHSLEKVSSILDKSEETILIENISLDEGDITVNQEALGQLQIVLQSFASKFPQFE